MCRPWPLPKDRPAVPRASPPATPGAARRRRERHAAAVPPIRPRSTPPATEGRSASRSRPSPRLAAGGPTRQVLCAGERCAPPRARRSRRQPKTGSRRPGPASPAPARATATSPRPCAATKKPSGPRFSPSLGSCASLRSTGWPSRTWSIASSPRALPRAPSAPTGGRRSSGAAWCGRSSRL